MKARHMNDDIHSFATIVDSYQITHTANRAIVQKTINECMICYQVRCFLNISEDIRAFRRVNETISTSYNVKTRLTLIIVYFIITKELSHTAIRGYCYTEYGI